MASKKYLNNVPYFLVFSRIPLGILVLWLATHYHQNPNYKNYAVIAIIVALLTDVFDGITARHLNISNTWLRRADSNMDQIFWISVLIGAYKLNDAIFYQHLWGISVVLLLELSTYIISTLKFKKEVALHAISSKIFTLFLCGTIIQLYLHNEYSSLLLITIVIGIATRLENIAILLTLKQWTNDVPSIYHAIKLRNKEAIKRSKWFNG